MAHFIPRQRWIIHPVAPYLKNKKVLEIGGGICRTVYNLFNPDVFGFQYTGTDISFKRLMVAKSAMPSSDFYSGQRTQPSFPEWCF
jgi:ubiquinone/menaquinone biosynthesis C-methylase UbiE